MANPISDEIKTGTVGELLVQIRLLQYDVQAAPPLKDSGNDLIAIKGRSFRTIQVKTTTTGSFNKPSNGKNYEILAVVHLRGNDRILDLDETIIYLIPKSEVEQNAANVRNLHDYAMSEELMEKLFTNTDVIS